MADPPHPNMPLPDTGTAHFTDRDTEAQRGHSGYASRSHSRGMEPSRMSRVFTLLTTALKKIADSDVGERIQIT